MQGCGRFQAVRVLDTSGAVSVWYARPAGEEAGEKFVIKMIRADMHLTGGEELARDISLFVESAKLQKKLADAGAKHWPKVHEIGTSTDGACFVMDAYPLSVGKLIATKSRVSESGLTALVRGIVDGLTELGAQGGGRPHGGLRPNDVLLSDPDPGSADVLLADPAPAGRLRAESSRDDLRGIGSIIFQIVMGKPSRDLPRMPEKPGPEWGPEGALGRAGLWWFALCEALLNPAGGPDAITLDGLRAKLDEPRAGGGGKKSKKMLVVGVASVVLLAGGAGGAYALFPEWFGGGAGPVVVTPELQENWRNLCESMSWLYGLAYMGTTGPDKRELGTPFGKDWPALAAAAGDQELKGVGDLIRNANAKGLFGPKSAAYRAGWQKANDVPSDLNVQSCADVVAEIEKMRAAFLAWTPAAELEKPEAFANLSKAAEEAAAGPEPRAPFAAFLGTFAAPVEQLRSAVEKNREFADLASAVRGVQERWTLANQVDQKLAEFVKVRDQVTNSKLAAEDKVLAAFPKLLLSVGVREGSSGAAGDPAPILEDLASLTELGEEVLARLALADTSDAKTTWNSAYLVDTKEPLDDYQAIVASLEKARPTPETFRKWVLATQHPDLKPNDEITGWMVEGEPAMTLPKKLADDVAALREKMAAAPLKGTANIAAVEKELSEVEKGVSGSAPLARAVQEVSQKRKVQEIQTAKSNLTPLLKAARDHLVNASGLYRERIAIEHQDAEQWWKAQEEKGASFPPVLAAKWREIYQAGKKDYTDDQVKANDFMTVWAKTFADLQEQFGKRVSLPTAAGIDPKEFDALLARRQSDGLAAAVAGLPAPQAALVDGYDGVYKTWKDQAGGFATWAGQAERVVKGLGDIGLYLRDGYGPSDPLPDGDGTMTIASIEKELVGSAAFDDFKQLPSVLDRVRRIEAIEKTTDPEALTAVVRDAKPAVAAEGLAAWRRLGALRAGDRPVWPTSLDQLRAEATFVRATLPGFLTGISKERRAEFDKELEAQKRQRWCAAFSAIPSDPAAGVAQIEEAMRLAPEFGVRPEDESSGLSPTARFNAERWRLLDETKTASLKGEALKSRVRAFLDGVGKIQGLDAGSVGGFTTELASMVKGETVVAVPELSKLGPGAAGWGLSEGGPHPEPGKTVAYTKGGVTLQFAPIEVDLGGTPQINYILVSEVSVGMFDGLARQDSVDTVSALLGKYAVANAPTPPCAITWELDRDPRKKALGFKPAESWTEATTLSFYPDDVAALAGKPSVNSPMVWVTPQAAAFVAAVAGCRLPTEAEWRASVAAYGAANPNLRDPNWSKITARIQALLGGADPTVKTQASSIHLPPTFIFPADKGVEAAPDDGTLWFRDVTEGSGVRDLRGNAAEFVLADAAVFDAAGVKDQVAKPARDSLPLFKGNVKVVLGSALSSPADADAPPAAYADAYLQRMQSFADVGFRLAFSAGPGGPKPLEDQFADAVAKSGYLAAR